MRRVSVWESANASGANGLWEAVAAGKVGEAAVELHSKPATLSSTSKSFELDLLEVMFIRRPNLSVYRSLCQGARLQTPSKASCVYRDASSGQHVNYPTAYHKSYFKKLLMYDPPLITREQLPSRVFYTRIHFMKRDGLRADRSVAMCVSCTLCKELYTLSLCTRIPAWPSPRPRKDKKQP